MKVHPKDLVPGCLLIKDVSGRTVFPIVPKNTVIEPIHIKILNDFQVPYVEVASKLVNGQLFKTTEVDPSNTEQEHQKEEKENKDAKPGWSFYDYYVYTVKETKELFNQWEQQNQLDLVKIRNIIQPLVQIGENFADLLMEVHHYTDKQDYFYHHIVAVPVIAAFLAKKLKYNKNERLQIALAAYLSDLGMLKEDWHLYKKDGVLTDKEFERVKKHPVLSYRLIEQETYLSKDVKIAVLQHHERLDGSGYPLGIQHEKLHPFARIIAVSDMFHAMTSERVYRKKQSPFKAIEEMLNRQFGKLDMKIVRVLVNSIVFFSNGTKVRLTNSEIGEIVFIDQKHPTRPMIKMDKDHEIIHLLEHKDLYIEEVLMN
ncbi:HD-GYP domain-containing protein [Tenuibacillus multivorans]|uniref:HD-GYP domain, c-di-GMP phosphodiesterase class II (Or its inactivated variant) n=1 Tax=Tenuibacillus multivorans TaxID=237069 RepID=A0A1G9W4X5_9BACI|nr:HD-GYP domain-containing protein [Tenuibacillus multivorans]GEL76315.1 HD family phosphohydrolase [Tenuibacillus multivorans]SDM79612.1 HD-GYP domain, c-di-GMP phosphodiesterase class II (or its inactivated variant) [Tenuibacillus multivorans]